ncbi:MAG: sodium:calcium antiporter [Bdellovibrionales bacterium]
MNPSLIPCIYLLVGFALMIIGADRLIKGAVDIAVKFNLSKVLIGAVLIGFGTSAPELFTSLYSASVGEGVLAAGNVIGSNIFNSTLVMGTCLLFPFILSPSEKSWQNIILLLLPSVLILIFASDLNFSKLEGLLLLTPLPVFLYLMITQTDGDDDDMDTAGNINLVYSFLWIALGGAGLYFGSNFAIKGSLELVSILGLSKGFAGAVILAAGTGLPELVTTIVAGVKREISLAFANIIGSNALNAFAVLGISSALFPFNIPSNMAAFNAPILLAVSIFGLLPLMFFTNKYFIKTWAGVLFGAYLTFTFLSI